MSNVKIIFGIILNLIFSANFSKLNAQNTHRIACIGFYNFENLFDTEDSPDTDDLQFTPAGDNHWKPEQYTRKLDRLAKVIADLGTEKTPDGPAILGVAEIENRKVLEDFVQRDAVKNRHYAIVHFDSPDPRGIDVALLYQPKYFKVLSSRAIPMKQYDAEGGITRGTRDILFVSGLFDGEPLHLLVNHWPSRSGGEKATQPFRNAAAMLCKKVVDSLQAQDPNAKVLIMGDLNDDPVSPSVKEVLNAKRDLADVRVGAMYNTMYDYYKKGIGTLAYQDAWSLFDQIILSSGLANPQSLGYHFFQSKVFNAPYLTQTSGQYKGYPLRTFSGNEFIDGYSDHFPVCIYVVKKL
jgi:hypothetical protein